LAFAQNRQVYTEIYFLGQTVKVGLAIFVILELYQLALAQQPALARFGRRGQHAKMRLIERTNRMAHHPATRKATTVKPKKPETTHVALRLNKQLMDQVYAFMKQTNLSAREVIERGLELVLKQHDPHVALPATHPEEELDFGDKSTRPTAMTAWTLETDVNRRVGGGVTPAKQPTGNPV
jgi:hypothetical protein